MPGVHQPLHIDSRNNPAASELHVITQMTTLIVHGTFAATEDWYWNSWHREGFCQSLSNAMIKTTGNDDIWKVGGIPVDKIEGLNPKRGFWLGRIGQISQQNGHFIWSGDYNAISRKLAAEELVKYLNVLRSLTDEPIRIIAHSHGCNVVKQMSSSKKLRGDVYIKRAVFLACPHFLANDYRQKGPFDMRPELVGTKCIYRLHPRRFGRIANIYSPRDIVVKEIADKLATPSGRNYEIPIVSFVDQDQNAKDVYENHEMKVPHHIRGSAVHSWLHGPEMASTIGLWLGEGKF